MCHCFSRNCPEGLPNHKSSSIVGKNCVLNSQGRHYRDPSDPTNPVCDYVSTAGTSCTFFSSGHDHCSIPYPSDVSVGPVIDNNQQSSDMSAILCLLQQQKADNEQRNADLQSLQAQVASLLKDPPVTTSPIIPLVTAPVTNQTVPTTTTAPSVPSSSGAASLSNFLSNLGTSNPGNYFSSLTNNSLPSGPVNIANNNLTGLNHMQNPLDGMGAAIGVKQVISSVDQLYAATTVNKQLRSFEFASTGNFPYKSQLKQENCNAVCFAFGAFKHLEAAKSGLIIMNDAEFLARLKHLKNVFEIACLSSNLASFADQPWQVAREYDARVTADIESGVKTWTKLGPGLETDAIYVAKETVDLKNKSKKQVKEPKNRPEKLEKGDPKKSVCTTFNTHRSSEGCYWEQMNEGKTCIFEHVCSWCQLNRNTSEKHKLINCEFKIPE